MKVAFVFPGQGSQHPGMGKELYNKYDEARRVFDKASDILGFSIKEKCFEGDSAELKKTEITQPAILTTSIAAFEVLKSRFPHFKAVAGHSLGEYSALYASGALDLESVIKLVQKRGEAMSKISGGVLAALIGKDFSRVEELCEASGYVISIYNSPKQVILAGEEDKFEDLSSKVKEYGIRKARKLKVSGPFHSYLMEPAAKEFALSVDKVKVRKPDIPVYMNVTAKSENDADTIKQNMIDQVYKTVKWKQEIEKMIGDGFDTFVELGPGKVLCGIISAINDDVTVMGIEKPEELEEVLRTIS